MQHTPYLSFRARRGISNLHALLCVIFAYRMVYMSTFFWEVRPPVAHSPLHLLAFACPPILCSLWLWMRASASEAHSSLRRALPRSRPPTLLCTTATAPNFCHPGGQGARRHPHVPGDLCGAGHLLWLLPVRLYHLP